MKLLSLFQLRGLNLEFKNSNNTEKWESSFGFSGVQKQFQIAWILSFTTPGIFDVWGYPDISFGLLFYLLVFQDKSQWGVEKIFGAKWYSVVEKHLPHVNIVLVKEYLRFAFPTILCGFEKIMVSCLSLFIGRILKA